MPSWSWLEATRVDQEDRSTRWRADPPRRQTRLVSEPRDKSLSAGAATQRNQRIPRADYFAEAIQTVMFCEDKGAQRRYPASSIPTLKLDRCLALTHVLPPISTSRFAHLCRSRPAAPFSPLPCGFAFYLGNPIPRGSNGSLRSQLPVRRSLARRRITNHGSPISYFFLSSVSAIFCAPIFKWDSWSCRNLQDHKL